MIAMISKATIIMISTINPTTIVPQTTFGTYSVPVMEYRESYIDVHVAIIDTVNSYMHNLSNTITTSNKNILTKMQEI